MTAITETEAQSKIRTLVEKPVIRSKNVKLGLLLLHSDALDLHWSFTAGDAVKDDSLYLVSSIGKTFTSALIGQLVDE